MNKKIYKILFNDIYVKTLIRVKLVHDIPSNLWSRLYNWNNPIKNKNIYIFFKKYVNFLNLWPWLLNSKHPKYKNQEVQFQKN